MRKPMIVGLVSLAAALALLDQAGAQTLDQKKIDKKITNQLKTDKKITDQLKTDKKITDKKIVDTVITVEDLDCEACAETIRLTLEEFPEIAKIKFDVDNWTATVTHHPGKATSPKLLWEAIEECGFVPMKLEGPSGTFTKKPPA